MRSLLISFTTLNNTPASGGYISMLAPSAPVTTTADIFNTGQQWSASVTAVPTGTAGQFVVYVSGANAEVVVDVVGFFAAPLATGLQCVETADTSVTVTANGGTANAVAPACAAGYTQTATNCESSTWLMPFVFFQSGTCSSRNGDTSNATLRASRTCCRVPGR